MQSELENRGDALISIIIPVYNVEPFLKECINSVVSQTYTNLEILLIDDGSTDGSPAICDYYAMHDSRIKVVHKKNGGLSDARNTGMNICSGKYVYFLDSDDYISNDAMEKLLDYAEFNDLDIVLFDAYVIDENGRTKPTQHYIRKKQDENIYDGKTLFSKLEKNREFIPCIPMMFFSKNVLDRRFKDILHEDELFTIRTYYSCERVAYNKGIFYYRRIRSDSIMTTSSPKHYLGYVQVIKGIDDLIKKKDSLADYAFRLYRGCVRTYASLNSKERKEIISDRNEIRNLLRKRKFYGIFNLFMLVEFDLLYFYIERFVRKIAHGRQHK